MSTELLGRHYSCIGCYSWPYSNETHSVAILPGEGARVARITFGSIAILQRGPKLAPRYRRFTRQRPLQAGFGHRATSRCKDMAESMHLGPSRSGSACRCAPIFVQGTATRFHAMTVGFDDARVSAESGTSIARTHHPLKSYVAGS